MNVFAKMAAQSVIQSMTKEDLEEIMNGTLDHMLHLMSKQERQEFASKVVLMALRTMLSDMTSEDKTRLLNSIVPQILEMLPVEHLDNDAVLAALANRKPSAADPAAGV